MPTPEAPAGGAVQQALARLAGGETLDESLAQAAFDAIMTGSVSASSIAALLMGMRARGETAEEIAGAVRALRRAMRQVAHARPDVLVDTCGTGGGTVTTINVSTAAAFVVAGAGGVVAKHGNRSYTSRSGSADVLEALGVAIDVEPEHAAAVLDEAGIVFLFAPRYHPAMRHVGPVRRELGVPTLMNLVGPLANPAGARRQVVGVSDPGRAARVAEALGRLPTIHALVVHADIGMDEISPVGPTRVWEVSNGIVEPWTLDPASYGLAVGDLSGLEGGTPAENADRILRLMESPRSAAAALRAAVLLNAGAAIYAAGLAANVGEAMEHAAHALDGGAGRERLEMLRRAAPRPHS
jgi:anthranilate phosphoribosyltransferase